MTLTALKPRPFVLSSPQVTIELVLARPEDLKILVGYDTNNSKIFKKRVGMIYWLRSSLTGIMEPTPRIITEDCDPKQIKEWLDFDMIYVAKNQFFLF